MHIGGTALQNILTVQGLSRRPLTRQCRPRDAKIFLHIRINMYQGTPYVVT